MRIFIASVGGREYHQQQVEVFRALAAADEVGRHQLAGSPESADAILLVDLHQHPSDPHLRIFRDHEFVGRWTDKIFVYDERDLPFFTFPGIYVAATQRAARHRPIVGGPYAEVATPLAPATAEPDLLFSFQGSRTHPVRDLLLQLHHDRAVVEDTTDLNFFTTDPSAKAHAQARYRATVARSKFVLCPRGHGPTSFRLYEVMSSGRVPVVISDAWLPPPGVNWRDAIVHISEADASKSASILEQLEPNWPAFASASRAVFESAFSGRRLWNHFGDALTQVSRASRSQIRLARWDAQRVRVAVRRTKSRAQR